MTAQPRTCPTRLQMALAVIILRNRPTQITPREYIHRLRAQVREGIMPKTTDKTANPVYPQEGITRYIDALSYWKQRAESAEATIHDLQVEVTRLQQPTDTMQTRLDSDGFYAREEPTTSKRKRESTKSKDSSKRLKPSVCPSLPGSTNTCGSLVEDLDALDGLGTAGETLVLNLYSVHKLQRQNKLDSQSLCQTLVSIAGAIGSISIAVCKYQEQSSLAGRVTALDSKCPELSCVIGACARAFSSLLMGLGRMGTNVPRRLPSAVIYECVNMCDVILNSIAQISRLIAAERSRSESQDNSRKASPKGSLRRNNPLGALTHLLYDFISFLDKNDPFQREIFEGWLYVLLKRVGDRLYHFTFGHSRSKMIEDDIIHTLSTPDKNFDQRDKVTDDLAMKYEVRSIITVLKRAMALAPHHLNPRPANPKASGLVRAVNNKNLPTPSRIPLIVEVQEKLQRTLVTSMFGEEDDDEFSNVLRRPVKSGRVQKEPVVEEKDLKSWFEKEVWTLVGWDLLSREDEW
ncbi:hypothetical protein B0J11DRAFT_428381 [Dendryphion nanum]|uniref:Uncharacterized protein n=1 Tax=Dendryphion nanum TaxID=256645 RepID=A0A9P9E7M1_9PLEO|nr:hypothetical protein B0J11DRAFT_428381 [Dendryphion nanum]